MLRNLVNGVLGKVRDIIGRPFDKNKPIPTKKKFKDLSFLGKVGRTALMPASLVAQGAGWLGRKLIGGTVSDIFENTAEKYPRCSCTRLLACEGSF